MKHKLLLVEDDPDTSEMLRVYFEAQGYHIIQAFSGNDALQQCQASLPDLILLDVRLPDIDGMEVGKQLQNDLRTSRIPIIFVTERQERDFRISGLKLGAVDYITKPFDIQELRLKVRNTLRRSAGQSNPITSLPGEMLTTQKLATLLKVNGWAALGVSVTGLPTFNEIYGFVARDDVVRAMALILTSVVDEIGTVDDFVGHPTEDRFIITTVESKVYELNKRIQNRLNQAMLYFYPIHDRETGYAVHRSSPKGRVAIPFLHVETKIITEKDTGFSRAEDLARAFNLSL